MSDLNIYLPESCRSISSWKVKSGASVRRGETVAIGLLPSADVNGMPETNPTENEQNEREKKEFPSSCEQESTPQKMSECVHKRPRFRGKKGKNASQKKATNRENGLSIKIVAPGEGFLRTLEDFKVEDGKTIIGVIEPCKHPAIFGGLCAVCGVSVTNPLNPQKKLQHTQQRVTVSGGVTMTISSNEAKSLGSASQGRLLSQKKLNLVLDLDHTLVHATADQRAASLIGKHNDVRVLFLPITENGIVPSMKHYIKLRPHLKEFFSSLEDMFEISIYTAGTRGYANQVANVISCYLVGMDIDEEESRRVRHMLNVAKHELHTEGMAKAKEMEKYLAKDTPHDSQVKLDVQRTEFERRLEKQRKKFIRRLVTDQDHAIEINSKEGSKIIHEASHENSNDSEKESKLLEGKLKESEETVSTSKSIKRKSKCNGEENLQPEKKKKKVTWQLQQTYTSEKKSNLVVQLEGKLKQIEALELKAAEARKKIFGSRIVSRTDVGDLGRDVKSLKRVFPCGGDLAVMVDDREDVWTNQDNYQPHSQFRAGEPPSNLLWVKPYHWKHFLGYADVNNASGIDLTKNDHAEEEVDDVQLKWTAAVLKQLHKRFFSQTQHAQKSVPTLLREMRKETFTGGIKIVFSGLVPLHLQGDEDRVKPRPPVIRYAQDLGAEVLYDVDETATHVVAAREGTQKVLKGWKMKDCDVVKVAWLMESYWSMKKADTKPHVLSPVQKDGNILESIVMDNQIVSNDGNADFEDDTDNDDYDDSFATELEKEFIVNA